MPAPLTPRKSIFDYTASFGDISTLAETARFLHVLDGWFSAQGLVYLTVGTVTISLPLSEAEPFLRGLLQRYDEGARFQA